MLSEIYYILRSSADGRYLVAHPHGETLAYLLLFRENFDALSYLNIHAGELANRFTLESFPGTQLGNLIKRWGFRGVGIVIDPLLPKIDFMKYD